MSTPPKKSKLSEMPAVALSVLTAIASLILIFLIALLVNYFSKLIGFSKDFSEEIADVIAYLGYGIMVAIMCFVICQVHPKSFWYTLVICNAVGIIAAIAEPNFWTSDMWVVIGIGWILSIIGTGWGTYKGNHRIKAIS